MQREVPDREVFAAARLARAGGAKVLLNNAPALPLEPDQVRAFDAICVNETEAAILGRHLGFSEVDPGAVVARLAKDFGVAAIATLGPLGAVLCQDGCATRRRRRRCTSSTRQALATRSLALMSRRSPLGAIRVRRCARVWRRAVLLARCRARSPACRGRRKS